MSGIVKTIATCAILLSTWLPARPCRVVACNHALFTWLQATTLPLLPRKSPSGPDTCASAICA